MSKNVAAKWCYVLGCILVIVSVYVMNILPEVLAIVFLIIGMGIFLFGFFFCKNRGLDIFIFLVIASECFYISTGRIASQDLFVCFIILLIIKMMIYKNQGVNKRYKLIIFSLIALAFMSAFNAVFEFSQSYIDSILPFRHYIILFSFFLVVDWFEKGYRVNKYLIIVSFIALSLFITQYYLYNKINFLDVSIVTQRLGSYRIHFQTLTPILGAIVAFNYFMSNKKGVFKWFALLVYLMGLFFTIFVNQTRTYMFGLIIAAILIYLCTSISLKNKLKIIMGVAFLLIILSPLYVNSVTELVESSISEVANKSGNYGVRQDAINYYVNLAKEHLVIGNGLINLRTGSEALLPGYAKGYFWVDIGIYGLFFLHGILGVVWYLFVFYTMVKSYKKLIKYNQLSVLGYAIFGIITMTTIGPFYFYLFPTMYCLAIVQYVNREHKRTGAINN